MSEKSYQWVGPLGILSAPLNLNEVTAQIEQGRAFPPQLLAFGDEAPRVAYHLEELKAVWARVSPSSAPFKGATGRVNQQTLCRLFAHVALNRATGYLYLRQRDAGLYYAFRFVDGQLFELCAHDPSTFIGQVLVQQDLITPKELEHGLALAQEKASALGTSLIEAGYLNSKGLQIAIAAQLFTRLKQIASFPYADVLFRPDRRAKMSRPVARVSGYSLLEISLGYGLSDAEIKVYMDDLLSQPLIVDFDAIGIGLISAEDRTTLRAVESQKGIRGLINARSWTERDAALKAIAWDMIKLFEVQLRDLLIRELERLEQGDVYQYLGIQESDSDEVWQEALDRHRRRLQLDSPSDDPVEGELKKRILVKYQRLRAQSFQSTDHGDSQKLSDELQYQSMMSEGVKAYERGRYADALATFTKAVELQPKQRESKIYQLWMTYLADPKTDDGLRSNALYQSVIKQLQILSKDSGNALDYGVQAQIHRVQGQYKQAEDAAHRALKIRPEFDLAKRELQLILNREFDEQKKVAFSGNSHMLSSSGALFAIVMTLIMTLSLWYASTQIRSARQVWPVTYSLTTSTLDDLSEIERKQSFFRTIRTSYPLNLIATAGYRLGLDPHPDAEGNREFGFNLDSLDGAGILEIERVLEYIYERYEQDQDIVSEALILSDRIPPEKMTIGNVEDYWIFDDIFPWVRRTILFLFGLIGILRFKTIKKPSMNELNYIIIAIIYGVGVGYLSPYVTSSSDTWQLLIMRLAHSVSEQIFFVGFLGLALIKSYRQTPWLAVGITTTLYGIYRLSYFFYWHQSVDVSAVNLFQGMIFSMGIPMVLAWKSKGIIAPLLAHIALSMIPALAGLT